MENKTCFGTHGTVVNMMLVSNNTEYTPDYLIESYNFLRGKVSKRYYLMTFQYRPSKLFKLLQLLFNYTKHVNILASCDFGMDLDSTTYAYGYYDETGSISLQMFEDLLDRACSKRTIQYQPSKLFRLLQSIFN